MSKSAGDCRHFTGIQHERCETQVRYRDVRDESGGPYRWPCLVGTQKRPCATTCPKYDGLSQAEVDAQNAAIDLAVERALAGTCPECGGPLEVRETPSTELRSCPTHGLVMRSCKRVGA